MFTNVLVGVDGRPGGRDAIALASRLIGPDGKLTLVHAHGGELRLSHAISPGAVREERAASQELLEQERAAAEVSAELVSIVAVNPGSGLHMQAEEQNADLLVVGSSGRSALGTGDARQRHPRRTQRSSVRGRDRHTRLRPASLRRSPG